MGKFMKKAKNAKVVSLKVRNMVDSRIQDGFNKKKNTNKQRYNTNKQINNDFSGEEEEEFRDIDENYDNDNYDEFDENVPMQDAQKPESFHHFILENQYKDLERSIRGYKDVINKLTLKTELKRKSIHCFTDEEAEDILRTAQSHLATDIKLGRISKDTFGAYMDALYKQLTLLFERIAEYKYGRYAKFNDTKTKVIDPNYAIQGAMKSQNLKIFLELWTRIQMNYSRAIGSAENIATHNSVKGQESLQNGERDYSDRGRGY
jgi:hypothetical protein